MFVNPPDITIFATSIINIISTSAGRELALAVQAFFYVRALKKTYIGICVPPRGTVMEPQHSLSM